MRPADGLHCAQAALGTCWEASALHLPELGLLAALCSSISVATSVRSMACLSCCSCSTECCNSAISAALEASCSRRHLLELRRVAKLTALT